MNVTEPAPVGLILLAHGARDPLWALPFETVAERVRQHGGGVPVRVAFLEQMTPSLLQAGHELAAAGCAALHVLPLFLGAGGHVRKDVPALVDTLRATHPRIPVTLHASIGQHPAVLQAMADVALSLLAPPQ